MRTEEARLRANELLVATGRPAIDLELSDTDFGNQLRSALGRTTIPPFRANGPAAAYCRMIARCFNEIDGAVRQWVS